MLWWTLRQSRSQDWQIRKRATEKLAASGKSGAIEALVDTLEDLDERVRGAAAQALGKTKHARAVELLIAALAPNYGSWRRGLAAKALGRIGAMQAIEPLVGALKDEDQSVRESAARALDTLGWEPTDDTQRASHAIALRSWDKVASIGASAIEPLAYVLSDPDQDLRKIAVQVLGKIRDPRAIAPLVSALDNTSYAVGEIAAKSLQEINDPSVVDALISALKDFATYTSGAERTVQVLGTIKDPRAVEPLISALQRDIKLDISSSPSRTICKALREIKDPRAVEPLISALGHETIAQQALEALTVFRDDPRVVAALENYESKSQFGRKTRPASTERQATAVPQVTHVIQCGKCSKFFEWREAFWQKHTPGAQDAMVGNILPRAFCPRCGALVAEYNPTADRWRWVANSEGVNRSKPFPPNPILGVIGDEWWWDRQLPDAAVVPFSRNVVDLSPC